MIAVAYLVVVAAVGYAVLGTYALGAVGFVVALAAYLLIAGWVWDLICSRRIRREIRDHDVIRDFTAEIDRWDAEQTAQARRAR